MARSQGPIPTKQPKRRSINVRSMVQALDGAEKPYDVYRFSAGPKYEKPRHNPFANIQADPITGPLAFTSGFTTGFE